MRTFELKLKCGEIINKVDADNLNEAIEIFAEVKKLTTKSLLQVFDVEVKI